MRAKSRLDEIRASMAGDKQLTAGDKSSAEQKDANAEANAEVEAEAVDPEVAGDAAAKTASDDVHDAEIEQVLEEAKKAVDDKE